MAQTPLIDDSFFEKIDAVSSTDDKTRWYYCVIVNLAALNFPEVVPSVYERFSKRVMSTLDHDAQFKTAQKLREALIKSCGIMGAAKTGTALRLLGTHIPKDLRDPVAHRAKEDQASASERGHAFHKRIYGRNPEFDYNASGDASPDYAFVVRDLLYGRVFSFDGILNDLETEYVVISALIGIDCQNQLRHHMKGALYNGATREDLQELYDVLLDLAERLGVKFRSEKREIPRID
ncbi:hypothetical protein KVR01_013240 [Diaporthe batatas]|uniref:uncharacterized protein n=1 Tax=Diaporthe batatas TaxID=748121 RepID=UPI001D0521F3|nr:uncharacterized protein KVR01_013240 [Diaporthe batatas]KAG8156827.1 hypothetical protein KVR01_013240 [Diaporthe batatas]